MILASLDGRSNWLSDDERLERLALRIGVVVDPLGGVPLGLWWRRRRQRAQS